MAMIRRSEAETVATKAVRLHLGDLARTADALRREAEEEIAVKLAEARRERARILAGASEQGYKEGFEAGHEDGFEEGKIEGAKAARVERGESLGVLERAWSAALERFEAERRSMLAEARRDIVQLAAMVAERVTRRVVELDTSAVEGLVEAALEPIARPTRVVVRVHPDDVAVAEDALPAVMRRLGTGGEVSIEGDPAAARGTCIAMLAGGGMVDASLETQIDRLVRALVGGEG